MKQYADYDGSGFPFPNSVHLRPNVIFHGTSNIALDSVLNNGIRREASIVKRCEVENLINFCKSSKNSTVRRSTRSLRAYAQVEVEGGVTRPIACKAIPTRTLIYTKREYAGGETAMLVLKSIATIESELPNLLQENCWLKQLKERLNHAQEGYKFGVILAICTDGLELFSQYSHDVLVNSEISTDNVIGYCHVSSEVSLQDHTAEDMRVKEWFCSLPVWMKHKDP